MPDRVTVTYFSFLFLFSDLLLATEATLSQNDIPLEDILKGIFERSNQDIKKATRRQLDFGDGRPPIEVDNWTGRYFPERVTERPQHIPYEDLMFEGQMGPFENSMWKMVNSSCDDGKTNLTVDWSGSPVNYTCMRRQRYFVPDFEIPNIIIKSLIPKEYTAKHECMQKEIHYPTDLPTFGTHRPAWPRYGEYKFIPRQRWIHSLEHGAVVMLYHPCAHPTLVNELRELVTGCLYRHIISPYNLLSQERPLALLTWGWALLMATPDEKEVVAFIRDHALRGPEQTEKDGQYTAYILNKAALVSDSEDTTLCPQQLY